MAREGDTEGRELSFCLDAVTELASFWAAAVTGLPGVPIDLVEMFVFLAGFLARDFVICTSFPPCASSVSVLVEVLIVVTVALLPGSLFCNKSASCGFANLLAARILTGDFMKCGSGVDTFSDDLDPDSNGKVEDFADIMPRRDPTSELVPETGAFDKISLLPGKIDLFGSTGLPAGDRKLDLALNNVNLTLSGLVCLGLSTRRRSCLNARKSGTFSILPRSDASAVYTSN